MPFSTHGLSRGAYFVKVLVEGRQYWHSINLILFVCISIAFDEQDFLKGDKDAVNAEK